MTANGRSIDFMIIWPPAGIQRTIKKKWEKKWYKILFSNFMLNESRMGCTAVWCLALSPHSKKVPGSNLGRDLFYVEVACSPRACGGSLWVLWLPLTVQKHVRQVYWWFPRVSVGAGTGPCNPELDKAGIENGWLDKSRTLLVMSSKLFIIS